MYTKQRVVKGHAVNITSPLLLDSGSEAFECLYNKIPKISKIKQNENEKAQQEEIDQKVVQAEQIIIEAENKAKEILDKAKEAASKIKLAAEEEIEDFKSEVAENTRQEIIVKVQDEANKILNEAQNLFLMAEKVLENEYQKVDNKLIELSILIAERVIKASLSVKPDYLLNIINAITLLPQEKEDLCLQLSQEDANWISEQGYKEYIPCSWIVNNSLRQGDIYLEHKKGFYDAQIQTQLTSIEQKLQEELAREQMGQAGEQAS